MICASIRENNMKSVLSKLSSVSRDYDLLEIYLNEIDDLDLDLIISVWKGKLLTKITDVADIELIRELALNEDINYIDIDLGDYENNNILRDLLNDRKCDLIISHHDFEGTPEFDDAKMILKRQRKVDADICKLIFTANVFEDNLVPFELLKHEKNLISFCMGSLGKLSRIYAPHLGCPINFVPPNEKWVTAHGQITLREWKTVQEALPPFQK